MNRIGNVQPCWKHHSTKMLLSWRNTEGGQKPHCMKEKFYKAIIGQLGKTHLNSLTVKYLRLVIQIHARKRILSCFGC